LHTNAIPNYQSSWQDPLESGRPGFGPCPSVGGPFVERVADGRCVVGVVAVVGGAVAAAYVVDVDRMLRSLRAFPNRRQPPSPTCPLVEFQQDWPMPCLHPSHSILRCYSCAAAEECAVDVVVRGD